MRGPGGPANEENKCSAASPATPVLSARQTLRWEDETEAKCSPASLTRAVGRSVEQDFLGGSGALPKWTRKKIRRRLLCSLARPAPAPASYKPAEGERSATAGEREAASLVRKWTEIVPAEANNAAPLSASLSLFAACSPRSFSGRRKDQLQPAGGAKAAGREREGGGKTKQQ